MKDLYPIRRMGQGIGEGGGSSGTRPLPPHSFRIGQGQFLSTLPDPTHSKTRIEHRRSPRRDGKA